MLVKASLPLYPIQLQYGNASSVVLYIYHNYSKHGIPSI